MENKQSATAYVVQDGSEMGKFIHTYDWSSTPLGSYPSWPKTLQFSLNMLLHANLPMVLFWGDHSFCFYNDTFLQLLPEKARRASLPGKAAADAWPETWAMVKPAIDHVRRTGKAISYDNDTSPLYSNDGHAGHHHHYSPIHDEAGTTAGVLLICSPKTRDELYTSRRLDDAVTGSTPDLMYIFDLNYKFIYANQALLNMWGRNWKDSAGKSLLEVGYEPWHAAMHEREIDQVIATKKPIRGEVAFPHAVMGYRMYDYIFAPVLNERGEVEAVAGTTRDISDLKVAELGLKHSEEQFRTLTQSLPQLIWTADIHGFCDFFNQQWYDYTGSRSEEASGKGWFMYVHPNHREQLYDKWERSLKTGDSLTFEFQLKARNGAYQWFHIVGTPIKDEDGEMLKWVSALTNIEEQKAVEEKLEQLVNERTGALQRSNDDLEQFAHVASHDLKEPVRKIKTFVDRLEHDAETKLSEKGSSYLTKINTAANRMYDMIEGVLNYSSIDNAEQPFSDINLNEILNSIELDLEILMNLKKARIVYDGLPTVKGAPLLIYQLFYNLINNSLKFTRPDTPPFITVTAKQASQHGIPYVRIDVKDNGIGFAQQQAQKIFNSFIRLNSKDKFEGTGLGLALCKKIAERHQGFITASGTENEGAVFSIFLPEIN